MNVRSIIDSFVCESQPRPEDFTWYCSWHTSGKEWGETPELAMAAATAGLDWKNVAPIFDKNFAEATRDWDRYPQREIEVTCFLGGDDPYKRYVYFVGTLRQPESGAPPR